MQPYHELTSKPGLTLEQDMKMYTLIKQYIRDCLLFGSNSVTCLIIGVSGWIGIGMMGLASVFIYVCLLSNGTFDWRP